MSSLSVRRLLAAGAFAAALLISAHTGGAAVFDVESTSDRTDLAPGNGVCAAFLGFDKDEHPIYRCTLRAAIQETNALPGADEITLGAETYLLTRANEDGDEDESLTGDLDVTDALEIRGTPGETVIDAGGFERAFYVQTPSTFDPIEVRFFGLELRNGSTPDADGGAALWNVGARVVLDTVTLRANRGLSGGALRNQAGRMSLVFSTVSGNEADAGGAAVSFGEDAAFYATNTTFSGNAATRPHPEYGSGGAIHFSGGVGSLLNVTIHDNEAAGRGGGIRVDEGVVVTIRNVLIAGNRESTGGDADVAPYGVLLSDGGNLIGIGTGSGLVPGVDQVGTAEAAIDPRLGPLGDNGGYNETHAPLADSPAIDRGNTSLCPPFDQRYEPRPVDGEGDGIAACDVGAVEYAPEPAAVDCASLIGVAASLVVRMRRSARRAR